MYMLHITTLPKGQSTYVHSHAIDAVNIRIWTQFSL